jgi:Flp pilus assembly pilin Flp
MLIRLLRETSGQDLLEYAMLTALVGLVGVAAWLLMETRIGQAYTQYDAGTQDLWAPPDPANVE